MEDLSKFFTEHNFFLPILGLTITAIGAFIRWLSYRSQKANSASQETV
jgi:hypothetical protein